MRPISYLLLALLGCATAGVSPAAESTEAPPTVLVIGKDGLSTAPAQAETVKEADSTAGTSAGNEAPSPGTEPADELPPVVAPTVNWEPIVQAMQMMIDQQKVTLQTMEQSGKEAGENARRQTEAMEKKMTAMEEALAAQRVHESETINRMNRLVVGVAAGFAGTGFVVMVLTAWFFMRTMNKVAEINANVQSQLLALPHAMQPLVGSGGAAGGGSQPANQRLLGALEQLERRIRDLEHTSTHDHEESGGPVHSTPVSPAAGKKAGPEIVDVDPSSENGSNGSSIADLLSRGQTLMNLDEAEQALECFDAVLSQQPRHAEALLKKGTALERLRRMQEALEAYNEAIRYDDTMTMAYLAKGGICNRLERYSEALECYEKALRTQQHSAA
ncbi:MAG TPA: hypothetical protein DCY13_22105 [Verrucomicrobiales bacterium]|nr:hypothetical protein [Verrucomicrobiales bacterium]